MSEATESPASTAVDSDSKWTADVTRRLGVGALWSGLVSATSVITGVATTVVLVRGMSHDAFGALAVGTAAVGVLVTLGSLGLAPAVARFGAAANVDAGDDPSDVARQAANDGIRIALPVGAVAAVVCAVVGLVMLGTSRWQPAGLVVLVSLPIVIVAPYQAVAGGYLTAMFRPGLSAGFSGGLRVGQFALCLAAVVVGLTGAYQIAAIRTVATIVAATLLIRKLRLGVGRRAQSLGAVRPLRPLFTFGIAMTLTVLVGVFMSQLDVFVLGLVRGPRAAGTYAPLSRLADACLLLPSALSAYLMPALAAARERDDWDTVGRLYRWTSRWAFGLAAPLLAVLVVVPTDVVKVLFGSHVTNAAVPLRLLAVGLFVHLLFGFNGVTLDAVGAARSVATRSGVALGVSLAACGVLIPLYGARGAAAATSIAVVVFNLTCTAMLARVYRIGPLDGPLLCVVVCVALATVLSAIVASVISMPPVGAVFTVAATAGVPILCCLVFLERRAHTMRALLEVGA